DESFIPRSFSITHINLTHRNWTAVGIPDCKALPIVDPCGLITPFFDGWSIDSWIFTEKGECLVPSRSPFISQRILFDDDRLAIETEVIKGDLLLKGMVEVKEREERLPVCHIRFQARAESPGWLVVALRPYNPEGVSFIHQVSLAYDRLNWIINKKGCVTFSHQVERHITSKYRSGDVFFHLPGGREKQGIECEVGLATAAALFKIQAGQFRQVSLDVLLPFDEESTPLFSSDAPDMGWSPSLHETCRMKLPDQQFQFLYEVALRSLILHSPGEIYPGPFTYKRFWFRDAAFILLAMLYVGLYRRVYRAINRFPSKQTISGFFHSQEGEWDSNGEALWIMQKFCELTGSSPRPTWIKPIIKGGMWIKHKRLPDNLDELQAGLLPAGFSAEHLGPNDFYYWDNFWSVAGLRSAAAVIEPLGHLRTARIFRQEADALMQAIERSLERSLPIRRHQGLPASPYRRMDAGAVGSLGASYPLSLWAPDDQRITHTVDYLIRGCFVHGAFFHDMIHSGINAYLTLQIAQVLLRAGDIRFYDLVKTVADIASPTGQWPEAIHPRTFGGCMGDGQHIWAAAEWILMMRHLFIREEGNRLILACGITRNWLDQPESLFCGPTLTPYGTLSLTIDPKPDKVILSWQASWRRQPPILEIKIPGLPCRLITDPTQTSIEVPRP
ncbi:MAG: hypothetical protein ACMUIA_06975, partial [bacterium]